MCVAGDLSWVCAVKRTGIACGENLTGTEQETEREGVFFIQASMPWRDRLWCLWWLLIELFMLLECAPLSSGSRNRACVCDQFCLLCLCLPSAGASASGRRPISFVVALSRDVSLAVDYTCLCACVALSEDHQRCVSQWQCCRAWVCCMSAYRSDSSRSNMLGVCAAYTVLCCR